MKTLLAYVYAGKNTDLALIQTIVSEKKGIEVAYETDIENAVDAVSAQKFDLLIVDLDLPKEDYHKIQKLVSLIYPDSAVTEIDLTSRAFINFKIDQMIDKWKEANNEDNIRFFDLN